MELDIQVLAWDRHKNMTGLNRLSDPNPIPPTTGSPNTIQMQTNNKKPSQISFHSNRPKTIIKNE